MIIRALLCIALSGVLAAHAVDEPNTQQRLQAIEAEIRLLKKENQKLEQRVDVLENENTGLNSEIDLLKEDAKKKNEYIENMNRKQ